MRHARRPAARRDEPVGSAGSRTNRSTALCGRKDPASGTFGDGHGIHGGVMAKASRAACGNGIRKRLPYCRPVRAMVESVVNFRKFSPASHILAGAVLLSGLATAFVSARADVYPHLEAAFAISNLTTDPFDYTRSE